MLKNLFLFIIGLIAIAAVALFFLGSSWLNHGVRSGVITFGPKITGTAIELDAVKLSIFSGRGALSGLRVANPEGFSDDFLASFGEIEIDLAPRSLFGDTVVIHRLHLREPVFLIEQNAQGNNLRVLQANIESFVPPSDEVDSKTGTERQLIIEELIIESGRLRGSIFGQSVGVNIPAIRLENVGSGEGVPVADLVEIILGEVLKGVGPALGNLGGRAADLGRDLTGRGRDLIENTAGQTTDRIRGLFNRQPEE